MIKIKDGVEFIIAPSGVIILQALKSVSRRLNITLTITSGSDGEHSGPNDPHKRGEAYDVRSHDFDLDLRRRILLIVNSELGDNFFGFLEDENTPNEHYHFQLKKGSVFNVQLFLGS